MTYGISDPRNALVSWFQCGVHRPVGPWLHLCAPLRDCVHLQLWSKASLLLGLQVGLPTSGSSRLSFPVTGLVFFCSGSVCRPP